MAQLRVHSHQPLRPLRPAGPTPRAARPPVKSPGAPADSLNLSPSVPTPNNKRPPIEVFFTRPGYKPAPQGSHPVQTDPFAPVTDQDSWKAPDQALAEFILSARKTIDIAAYELDNPVIRDAILKAHANQRRVRIVTDSDYAGEAALKALKAAGIPIVEDQRTGLMHNKFVIVDQGTPDAAVWTGSMNLTDNCAHKNNNNSLLIRSSELASNFTTEFEEMFIDKSFGRTSPSVVPHPRVSVGKSVIETHFAAEGKVAGRVAEALNKAQTSIHFMAFSFTHDAIGEVVAKKFSDRVAVRGVFEKTGSNTQHSEFNRLKALGADVRTDGNPKILHHKVFVIDAKTVVTGSFNFSASADQNNDENLLIIEDPELAKQYLEEFERVYKTSVQAADAPVEPVDLDMQDAGQP